MEAHQAPCPWDFPGKNTGVGCHFLLQCMKVKSESEVTQSCPTLRDPMDCSLPGSAIHGIFQARVLEWGAISLSNLTAMGQKKNLQHHLDFPLPPHRACEFPSPLQSSSLLANLENTLCHLQNYSDLISSMKDPLILPRKISLFLLSKNLIPWVHHHEGI